MPLPPNENGVMNKFISHLVFRTLLVSLFALPVMSAQGQSKVKERNLGGTWKLVLDLEEEIDEEEDNVGARMIIGAVSGLLSGVDIEMQFHDDNQLKIVTDAYGDEDVEWSSWEIKKGRLYLGDSDSYSFDETYWMFKRNRLVAYEYNEDGKFEEKRSVFMYRLD